MTPVLNARGMFGALALAIMATAALAQSTLLDQSPTLIEGTVLSTAGTPIAGYPVIISDTGSDDNIVLFTNKDGSYSLRGLAEGTYELTAGTLTGRAHPFELQIPPDAAQTGWRLFKTKPVEPAVTLNLPELTIAPGAVKN